MIHKKRHKLTQFIVLVWLSLLLPLVAQATSPKPATIPVSNQTQATQSKVSDSSEKLLGVDQQNLQSKIEKIRASKPLSPPDIQRILDRGKLIVAMPQADNPPFYAINEKGEYWGLDVELARGFAALLGVGIIFDREAKSYNAAVERVIQRKSDVAWCKLSRTFQRGMKVRYTQPYIVLKQALLINRLALAKQAKTSVPIEETVQNLKGNIGVIAKSSYEVYAAKYFQQADVISYPTWEDVVVATAKGEVVAAYRDELEIKKVVKGNPESALKFKTAVISDTTDPLSVAVAWDSTTLLSLLNIYLENKNLNLNANRLLDRYSDILFKK